MKQKIKFKYVGVAVAMVLAGVVVTGPGQAASCPDVKIVFARGSGGTRWEDQNYLAFKAAIESKLTTTELSYEFEDLDYPAVGVGVDNLGVTAGAFFGSGDAYEFGESVQAGVDNLLALTNSERCPNTRYVVGGYSQGAMVVSKALRNLDAEKMIYAATFGDPKIYLPEGEGLMPAACMGGELSDYRAYVPDCHAYRGMLGSYEPYEPAAFVGKVGTWCNKRDFFCSSYLVMDDHTAYVSDNLYEDASRVIFDKITKTFGVENKVSSPHDTAILIDSTDSMRSMINQYKEEAYRLAKETLESGGRVALYDYRDLKDPYEVTERCNFETCTLESFAAGLDEITVGGGGDIPESLLASSFKVMKDLTWKQGSTKSLVVLTDADFLSPDRNEVTFDQVVELSKKIDPVNFYIITRPKNAEAYKELAAQTDGKVVTDLGELSLLTDYIMERYDSLPRVEADNGARPDLPTLEVTGVEWMDETTAKIQFATTGVKTLVALNDAVLGMTEAGAVEIADLDRGIDNVVRLVPLGEEVRGEGVEVSLAALLDWGAEKDLGGYGGTQEVDSGETLKAPDAGVVKLEI